LHLDVTRECTSFSWPKFLACIWNGELVVVDLVGEASRKIDFCVFEHDKIPNGLDVWILSLRALQNGNPKELVEPNSISLTSIDSPRTKNLVLLN